MAVLRTSKAARWLSPQRTTETGDARTCSPLARRHAAQRPRRPCPARRGRPAPRPLVHAIVAGISPETRQFAEGTIVPDGAGDPVRGDVGRNSYFVEGWLPPDPPSGHGEHDYAFQLFALSDELDLDANPGRGALVAAMAGKVIGLGLLIGTYSRGEASPAAPHASGAALA